MLNIQGKRQLNILKKISLLAIAGIFLPIFLVCLIRAEEQEKKNYGNMTFTVFMDANPPVISHTPIKLVNVVGNKIIIKAGITDNLELASVSLYYKKHSDKECKQVKQNLSYANNPPTTKKLASEIYSYNSPDKYDIKMEIPPGVVTPDGVDYYITATDGVSNTSCFSDAGYSQTVPSPVVPIEIEVVPINEPIAITLDGGTIVLSDGNPEDGETSLVIPPNALSKPTYITIRQIFDLDSLPSGNGATKTKRPVVAYEFSPDGLIFAQPATMNLLYFDLDKDGIVDGTNINEDELRIFWWDGYDWRYVGGKIDEVKNIMTTEISHFCIYALFPARELTASDYRPKNKIITPATLDGINDIAVFDGLEGKKVTIKIFDVTGKRVRTISEEPYQWDGRNDEERLVESGVYIYQFEIDGELISGMIAVAK